MINRIKYVLPFYHTVSDQPLSHIKALYPVKTIHEFIKELEYFALKYKIVSLQEFYNLSINNFAPVKKPVIHFTFDDGLRECYDVIAPILIRKGIPATFFINTGFIDNKDLFFRYKISIIIDKLSNEKLIHDKKLNEILSINSSDQINEKLLSIRYDQIDVIKRIADYLNINFNEFLQAREPYMSRNQIKYLADQGFNIGAHSVDHPEFRFIDKPEQFKQVQESIQDINNLVSQEIKAFSFPFTDYDISNDLFNQLFSNKIIDISFGTAGIKHDVVKMNFQRIPMETGQSLRQILIRQMGKHYIRSMIGINSIIRD